jgi:hypothetical protein
MFKYSGTSNPTARVYVLHNTLWTDRASVSGGAQYASGGSSAESFYLRNNLIRATAYAFDVTAAMRGWDEDGNVLITSDPGRGLRYRGTVYKGNVADYRAASGQGTRTNTAVGFAADASAERLAAREGGAAVASHCSLAATDVSVVVDAGVPVPNLSDRPGVSFTGAAPDAGACEGGSP